MQKRIYIKCALLVLFIGMFGLASHFLIEYERWGKAHYNLMWFEPSRAAAIFILSIFLGLFLRAPVTGNSRKDTLLSGGVLAALTIVQIFFRYVPSISSASRFWIFSHNLFTMWVPIMLVIAGVAIAGRIIRKTSGA